MTTPVFVGYATGNADFSNTVSASITGGASSNRCVLAFVITDRGGATTIDSCTCAGNAMTGGTGFAHGSGYDGRCFYIAGDSNISTGSNTVQATLSDGNTKPKILVCAFHTVDGMTPASGLTNVSGFGTAPAATVSSSTGDLVVFLGSGGTLSGAITGGTGTTVDLDNTLISGSSFYVFSMSEAGASSVSIGGTWSSSHEWWGTGLSLKAAAAGGGLIVNPLSGIGGAAANPLAKIAARGRKWWRGAGGLLVPEPSLIQ